MMWRGRQAARTVEGVFHGLGCQLPGGGLHCPGRRLGQDSLTSPRREQPTDLRSPELD